MTDENTGNIDLPEEGLAPALDPVPGASVAPASKLSSGQGMVALGCWIIVGIYLVTGLLMNEYWIPWLVLVPAIVVLILGRVDSRSFESIGTVPTLIKALGYLIALMAVLDVIEDIRFFSSAFDEFVDIVGSLGFWAAAVLCFLGARSIET